MGADQSHAALYTDSRARLAEALGLRDGAQVGAIDEIMGQDAALLDSKGAIHNSMCA